MYVSEVLRGKGGWVERIRPESTVAEAARLITEHRIGAVVVVDVRDRVIGILSERDIVRGAAAEGAAALDLPISDLMSSNVVSCSPDDDVKNVMQVMTLRRIRHLPVMEGDALTGIVSIGDLVKARLDEQAIEVGVLRDYARSH